MMELGIGLIELGIGLMVLGIGLRINIARPTVLPRVSGLVCFNLSFVMEDNLAKKIAMIKFV